MEKMVHGDRMKNYSLSHVEEGELKWRCEIETEDIGNPT